MGLDYWPYGVDRNRKTIEAQLRWAYEQGMSKKQWTVEAMFHPSTMTWYR
jgi:4,5-dihydroxyphthalate decarboxylase